MCWCAECCEERKHFSTREQANDAAGLRWVISQVSSRVEQCPYCWLWVLTR